MYYLYPFEIYTLIFYNQYNYKKLIIVVCFLLPFKVYYPFISDKEKLSILKIVDFLIIIEVKMC